MSVARRKLIAAASALGLGLSVASQAIGAPAHPPAKQRSGAPQSGDRHAGTPSSPSSTSPAIASTGRSRWLVARSDGPRRQSRPSPRRDPAGDYPTPESVGVSSATLDAIASCESGGDPTAVSADGAYRGKYQFDYGTWASVGGSGDPAAAPEAEQDYRAALLYARGGSSPWPICG